MVFISEKSNKVYMNKSFHKLLLLFVTLLMTSVGITIAQAKTSNVIQFKDKNLQNAICKYYKCKAPITKDKAHELSIKKKWLFLEKSNITDLEGIQYFDKLIQININNNKLTNIKPLSKLKDLKVIDISNNYLKGKALEQELSSLGKMESLDIFYCNNNEIGNISFLKAIGNLERYTDLQLADNKIIDISIFSQCINMKYLDLTNNRIVDITPLQVFNSKRINLYIDNNFMIDLSPIKPLFDNMFDGRCGEDSLNRSDYYQSPVTLIYKNKELQFPHRNVYYLYQAYAEAIPLIKAFGGSAEYHKETGLLTGKLNGYDFSMKDFSKEYTLQGKVKKLGYPMIRMQYGLAYLPVKVICDIAGLKYNILNDKSFYTGDGNEAYILPKLVEIVRFKKTGRNKNYEFINVDNHIKITKYLGSESNVKIPSQINKIPVTSIEDGVFSNNQNLTSVEIPETITNIGTYWGKGAFSDCKNLTTVTIHEGKEDAFIGAYSFHNCSKLSSITIPGNYKNIYDQAFSNCTTLKSINLSEGTEKIGAGAFAKDIALSSISLPASINAIGFISDYDTELNYGEDPDDTGAFANCNKLTKVTLMEGKSDAYIGVNAFFECKELKSITIPGNYLFIRNNAFRDCTQLKSFYYEKCKLHDTACQQIDEAAFNACEQLESISLSESLNKIGDYAFKDCIQLKEVIIPEGTKEIGNYAFAGDLAITSVSIPSTVISIGTFDYLSGGYSFSGCKNLAVVTLKEGKQNAVIEEHAFIGCIKLEKIVIPGNYTKIGSAAFSGCTELKTLIYQKNNNDNIQQEIDKFAFDGCESLITVSLPSTLTLLDDMAFLECTNLRTIRIPTGINQLIINDFVFKKCTSLSNVYIGDNVKCVNYTFMNSNTNMNIYSLSESIKSSAKAEGITVLSPSLEYIDGKSLFGSVEIIGSMKVGSILTANITAIVPIDAVVTYEWIIDNRVVSTESTYEIKYGDIGNTIKLKVKGSNEYIGILTKTIKI